MNTVDHGGLRHMFPSIPPFVERDGFGQMYYPSERSVKILKDFKTWWDSLLTRMEHHVRLAMCTKQQNHCYAFCQRIQRGNPYWDQSYTGIDKLWLARNIYEHVNHHRAIMKAEDDESQRLAAIGDQERRALHLIKNLDRFFGIRRDDYTRHVDISKLPFLCLTTPVCFK